MAETQEKIIQIAGSITVDELAEALGLSVTALIGELFKQGIIRESGLTSTSSSCDGSR